MRWLALLVLVGCDGGEDSPVSAASFNVSSGGAGYPAVPCTEPGRIDVPIRIDNLTDTLFTVWVRAVEPDWLAEEAEGGGVQPGGFLDVSIPAFVPCVDGTHPVGEHLEQVIGEGDGAAEGEAETVPVSITVAAPD